MHNMAELLIGLHKILVAVISPSFLLIRDCNIWDDRIINYYVMNIKKGSDVSYATGDIENKEWRTYIVIMGIDNYSSRVIG